MTDRKPTCVACKGAGGGATYIAGTGIVIESNEISADTSVLATKTELPDMGDYQLKLTAGEGITIDSNNTINAVATLGDVELYAGKEIGDLFEFLPNNDRKALREVFIVNASIPNPVVSMYIPKGITVSSRVQLYGSYNRIYVFTSAAALNSLFSGVTESNGTKYVTASDVYMTDFYESGSSYIFNTTGEASDKMFNVRYYVR